MPAYDQLDEQRFYDRADWGVMHDYQREVLTDLCAILPDDARTILDLGCGDGMITNRLPADRVIVGADLSPVALAGLKRPGVIASALALPFRDGGVDLVMANDVVEHFSPEHRAAVLDEIERVAARYVIVTVPFTEVLANGLRHSPRGQVHRNRHQDSFDVETVRNFFRAFQLEACLFSGVLWQDELAPVERLKALLAALEPSQDDGRERLDLQAQLEQEIARLRRRQAAFLSRYPERIDLLQRRTEMIALFARSGRDLPIKQRIAELGALDWPAAVRSAGRHDLLHLKGPDFQEFRVNDLPAYSLWPYAVFSGEMRTAQPGVELIAETTPACIKLGFFAHIEEGAFLEASLVLSEPAPAYVNHYAGEDGYQTLIATELPSGASTLRAGPLSLVPSEFGHLFELVVGTSRFSLLECRVEQPRRPERLAVASGPRYLSREAGDLTLLTSLAHARRRALPHWFASAEALPASPANPFFGSLDEVRLEFDTFRLRLGEPSEGWSARLLAETAQLSQSAKLLAETAQSKLAELASTLEITQGHLVQARTANLSLLRRLSLLESAAMTGTPWERLNEMALALRSRLRVRTRLRALLQPRIGPAEPKPAPPAPARPRPRVVRAISADFPVAVTMLVADDRIDRRVLLQARSLARQGVRVTVVAVPYPEPVDLDADQFPEIAIVRVDTSRAVHNPPSMAGTRLEGHPFAWKEVNFYHDHFLKAALENPAEIVVAHDLPVLPAAVAAADLLGADVFYDAHELYPEQMVFGPERMQLYRDVEAALIRYADVATTINASIADELARRYGVPTPHVILNAPEAPVGSVPVPRTRILRDAFGLRDDQILVLFQGSLSFGRNLEPLAASLAHVRNPDVVLVFMGPGAAKRAELEAIARERNLLGTRVFFHDSVPQSELLRYTASADIGVIPYPAIDLNTTYCTPNKLFEFLTAGLPILANDLPELRRFVADQGVGLTHAMTNAEAIAAGIDRICAADLTGFRSALRDVAPRMTWDAQEVLLLKIYRDFIRQRGQKAA